MAATTPADGHARLREVTPSPVQRVLIVANQTANSPALITDCETGANAALFAFTSSCPR